MSDPLTANTFSWAAVMGGIQNVILLLLGGGGIVAISRAVTIVLREFRERAKQEDEAENKRSEAVRTELMSLVDRQAVRIDKLEKDLHDERQDHAEEVSRIRIEHAEEIVRLRTEHANEVTRLREQVEAMQRIIVQWQASTGRAIDLAALGAPKSAEALDRLIDQIDKGNDNA